MFHMFIFRNDFILELRLAALNIFGNDFILELRLTALNIREPENVNLNPELAKHPT